MLYWTVSNRIKDNSIAFTIYCAPVHVDSIFLHSAWFIISLSPSVIFDSLCTFIPNWHNLFRCSLVRLIHYIQISHDFSESVSFPLIPTVRFPLLLNNRKHQNVIQNPQTTPVRVIMTHTFKSHTFKEDDNSEIRSRESPRVLNGVRSDKFGDITGHWLPLAWRISDQSHLQQSCRDRPVESSNSMSEMHQHKQYFISRVIMAGR